MAIVGCRHRLEKHNAGDTIFYGPIQTSIKKTERRDGIGAIARRLPVWLGHDLVALARRGGSGQENPNLKKKDVLNRIAVLEAPALRGAVRFMMDQAKTGGIALVTSDRVLKVLPIVKRLDEEDMRRFLNAVHNSAPSEAMTEPDFLRFVVATQETVRTNILAVAGDFGARGVLTLSSKEAREFVRSERVGLLDPNSRYQLFKAAAAKADARFFSKEFVGEILPLGAIVRASFIERAFRGTDSDVILKTVRIYRSHLRVGRDAADWDTKAAAPSARKPGGMDIRA